jgi:tetratricopeptide (TPR) repeat protein
MNYYDLMIRFTRLPLILMLSCALSGNAQTTDNKALASPRSALSGELFYQLLLGELNVREGEPGAGYSLVLDVARKTKDAKLFQRAVEIALLARSGDSALLAARAWKQTLPDSREANRFIIQILTGLNRPGDTLEPLKFEISATPPIDRNTMILAIPRYFTRVTDKKLAATTVEQAVSSYTSSQPVAVAAWTTIGRMRLEAGDTEGALAAARKAQAVDTSSEYPALLALAMMNAKVLPAEDLLKKYLAGPAKPDIQMDYARLLLGAQRYADGQTQLQAITTKHPDYAPAWLIQGALALQEKNDQAAESSFLRYVALATGAHSNATTQESNRGLTQAYLSLAQIAEQRQEYAQADTWLQRIDSAEDRFNAQMRRAAIWARQGKLDEARLLIRSQPEKSPADARLKITSEAQLLREHKQYLAAYELLAEAATRYPSDLDLFYDMAMVAEKLNKLDDMERLLRSIIAVDPKYHHAYNALGYSLAERGLRLPEAKQLIQKALEYAPGDPFISDSLGWLEFRSGNFDEALRILQEAFATKPDAEIAAHLGEVLWRMGRRDQALEAWRAGAKLNSDNETLMETLKRLRVTL